MHPVEILVFPFLKNQCFEQDLHICSQPKIIWLSLFYIEMSYFRSGCLIDFINTDFKVLTTPFLQIFTQHGKI